MNHTHTFPLEPSVASWRLSGRLALPVNSVSAHQIALRLSDILGPLGLPAGFQSKLLQSAQEAVERGLQTMGQAKQVGPADTAAQIVLLIFSPQEHPAERSTWGFFRTEKAELPTPEHPDSGRSIAFYLYLEG